MSLCLKKTQKNTEFRLFFVYGVPVFFAESSKELEELRAAFSRSLDYMKQDVEESKWISVRFIFVMFFV